MIRFPLNGKRKEERFDQHRARRLGWIIFLGTLGICTSTLERKSHI